MINDRWSERSIFDTKKGFFDCWGKNACRSLHNDKFFWKNKLSKLDTLKYKVICFLYDGKNQFLINRWTYTITWKSFENVQLVLDLTFSWWQPRLYEVSIQACEGYYCCKRLRNSQANIPLLPTSARFRCVGTWHQESEGGVFMISVGQFATNVNKC